MKNQYHLAQINVARMLAPLDDPLMADFAAQLDPINLLAEQTPGFVWRLKTDDGRNSSYIRAFDDDLILINMSVWETIQSLQAYVYRSQHGQVYRDRAKWLTPFGGPPVALWWIPAGYIPSMEDGKVKLEILTKNGPTAEAFTFKKTFPPPEE